MIHLTPISAFPAWQVCRHTADVPFHPSCQPKGCASALLLDKEELVA